MISDLYFLCSTVTFGGPLVQTGRNEFPTAVRVIICMSEPRMTREPAVERCCFNCRSMSGRLLVRTFKGTVRPKLKMRIETNNALKS